MTTTLEERASVLDVAVIGAASYEIIARPEGTATTDDDLARVAAEIRSEHAAAEEAARAAVKHALRVGILLAETKEKLPHGKFGPWLADNVNFTERTAQRYMQLARWCSESPANATRVSDLSLRDALSLMTKEPRRPPDVYGYQPQPDPDVMFEELAQLVHKHVARLSERQRNSYVRRGVGLLASAGTARDPHDRLLYACPTRGILNELRCRVKEDDDGDAAVIYEFAEKLPATREAPEPPPECEQLDDDDDEPEGEEPEPPIEGEATGREVTA